MNSKNSKTTDPHKQLILQIKQISKGRDKYVALSNLSIYYIEKNKKTSYKHNKFKISVPAWNDKFKLADKLYSASDIQDYFEYIIKKT